MPHALPASAGSFRPGDQGIAARPYPIIILINVGMWFERFVIISTSLHRDFLPSSWDYFSPTKIDVGLFVGSIGLFFTLTLLFCRFLPTIATSELKMVSPGAQPKH